MSANRAASSHARAQCSPNRGDASSRSTTRSNASARPSATKPATSSGDGGSPVKSSVTRRSNAPRSASRDGWRFSRSNRASTNASIPLRAQPVVAVRGNSPRTGGTNAQCGCRAVPAPSATPLHQSTQLKPRSHLET